MRKSFKYGIPTALLILLILLGLYFVVFGFYKPSISKDNSLWYFRKNTFFIEYSRGWLYDFDSMPESIFDIDTRDLVGYGTVKLDNGKVCGVKLFYVRIKNELELANFLERIRLSSLSNGLKEKRDVEPDGTITNVFSSGDEKRIEVVYKPSGLSGSDSSPHTSVNIFKVNPDCT